MKKFIFNLRQKPDNVKRNILHVSMLVIGFMLVGIWISTLGDNINDVKKVADLKNNVEPLAVLKDNLELPKW